MVALVGKMFNLRAPLRSAVRQTPTTLQQIFLLDKKQFSSSMATTQLGTYIRNARIGKPQLIRIKRDKPPKPNFITTYGNESLKYGNSKKRFCICKKIIIDNPSFPPL
jgi:hypothetical protein